MVKRVTVFIEQKKSQKSMKNYYSRYEYTSMN